jgi:catechol 2,3-dioxygenase-like lactoylglutathione lyase family enzyme
VSAHAAWAGIIVADVEASALWYHRELGGALTDHDERWAKLDFPNGTVIELFQGDRTDPGSAFPSYGLDPGPPVMPGYAVEEPADLAEREHLEVMRSLPDWVVVAAPDRLRVVLLGGQPGRGNGLVGFRYTTTEPAAQQRFLEGIAGDGIDIADGEVAVVPILRGPRSGEVTDPDGTAITLVRR